MTARVCSLDTATCGVAILALAAAAAAAEVTGSIKYFPLRFIRTKVVFTATQPTSHAYYSQRARAHVVGEKLDGEMESRVPPSIAAATGPSTGHQIFSSGISATLSVGCGCHGRNHMESSL